MQCRSLTIPAVLAWCTGPCSNVSRPRGGQPGHRSPSASMEASCIDARSDVSARTDLASSDASSAGRAENARRLPALAQLPSVGLGTSFYPEDLRCPEPLPAKGTREYSALQKTQTERAVLFAIEHGYRLIDTANGYSNQRAVGSAIERAIRHRLVRREELIIVCKIPARQLVSAESVREGVRQALERLQVSYVDVLMAHSPPVPTICWREMEAAVYLGQARALGVSNFDKSAGRRELSSLMAEAAVPPAVAQFESHPYNVNSEMMAHCTQHGLQVMAASPLGAPHKVGAYLARQRSVGKQLDDATKLVLSNDTVADIAAELGCTSGQLVLRWGIQRGHTVIPKSFAPQPHSHLCENFAAAEQPPLSEVQMARITSLDRGLRATALYKSAERNRGRVVDVCVLL